jgi:hypothetical protein
MAGGLRLNNMAEFEALKNRGKAPAAPSIFTREAGNNKHHNVICEADSIRFQSKKHRAHYLLLRAMQQAGEIRFFLREVPFDLIGHYENGRIIRHYVDFQLIMPDWTVRWQEVKGRDLTTGKMKRLQTEEIYGINIEVI